MAERSYRAVADPARLGVPERDRSTGRRGADRSEKARHRLPATGPALAPGPSAPGPRRALVAVGAIVVILLIGGVVAAVASRGGSGSPEASAPTTSLGVTPSSSAPAEGEDPAPSASPLDGAYDLTWTATEALSYDTGQTITGDNVVTVGTVQTGTLFVSCVGSECFVDLGGPLLGPVDWTADGATLTGSGRSTRTTGDGCAPQEEIREVELTIEEDGGVTGTVVEDLDPGKVACAEGFASGSRYAYDIVGQRTG